MYKKILFVFIGIISFFILASTVEAGCSYTDYSSTYGQYCTGPEMGYNWWDCPWSCDYWFLGDDHSPPYAGVVHTNECKNNHCGYYVIECDYYTPDACFFGGGGGLDESPPSCSDNPASLYRYGKSMTSLFSNASFNQVGPPVSGGCNGADPSGCYGSQPSAYQPAGWRVSQYAGVRTGCVNPNDGPQDPNNCDPSDAQCYNQCAPKEGTGQLTALGGNVCNYSGSDWNCNPREEKVDWDVSQVVSGLKPGAQYLFLLRNRGKATGYTGDCTGEGWINSRLRTVKSGQLNAGDVLYFDLNKRDTNNNDATDFNVTVTLYPDDGSPTQIHNFKNEFSAVQGQNNWYYLGCKIGENPNLSGGSCSQLTYAYDPIESGWGGGPIYAWFYPNDPYGFVRLRSGYFHPAERNPTVAFVLSKAGRVVFSGSVIDGDPAGGDGVNIGVWLNQKPLISKNVANGGSVTINSFEINLSEFYENWQKYSSVDSNWFGGKADDWWRTDHYLFTADSDQALVDIKNVRSDCWGWAPSGQADWLELIELCDENGTCPSGSADGIILNLSVNNGARSEAQLQNVFSDGSKSAWGSIADSAGQITNANWAPFSPFFFWKMGGANKVGIRFWNQRDQDQVVVDCGEISVTLPKRCTINPSKREIASGQPAQFSLTGNPIGSEKVSLWLINQTGSQPIGGGFSDYLQQAGNWYKLLECGADGSGGCTVAAGAVGGNDTINGLPDGNYYLACNVGGGGLGAGSVCSGNPFCSYEPCCGGTDPCTGFKSCHATLDNATLTVSPAPSNPWFQTTGGDLQAGSDINSPIPTSCVTTSNYLSQDGEGGTSGVVGYNGTLGVGGGAVSVSSWQVKAAYAGSTAWFERLANSLKINRADNLREGDIAIEDLESGVYYSSTSKNIIGSFPAGQKIVIFVDGTVNIGTDDIETNLVVEEGDFLAVIAKGNLTFDSTVAKAQGFFLTDGILKVEPGTVQFEGQGSFIGGDFDLQRDLLNNCYPAETFVERPDFYVNASSAFKISDSNFKEIEP